MNGLDGDFKTGRSAADFKLDKLNMKNLINELFFGRNSMLSGAIALAVVATIGIGCFCNKDKMGGLTENTSTTSSSPTPDASPSPSATKAYKKADASKAEIPSDDELQDMVKKTMLDFNSAIVKKDFNDFHGTVSKIWQKQITPEKMQESFQGFIDGQANFAEIKSMTAEWDNPAEITKSTGVKTLEAKGKYPTSPNKTEFELKYIAEAKEWKLIGIRVYTNVKK